MTAIQKACYILTASAVVLAALLLAAVQERFIPAAQATPLIVSRESLTMMTARTRVNQESLFVLDNASQKLLIYDLDVAKQRMNLAGFIELGQLFAANTGGPNIVRPGGNGGGNPRMPR